MKLRLLFLLSVLVLGLVLASCNQRPRRGGNPCYDATECSAEEGSLETCLSGYCEQVECLSSSDCPMGEVCDVDNFDYECKSGCNSDVDCLAGSVCDDGSCVEYGCRSTILDCARGEFCNQQTHECEQAEGPYCTECQMTGNDWDDGGTLTTCDDMLLGNDFCGGAGNYCVDWYFGTPVCFVSCDEQNDCPAGYTCQALLRFLPPGCTQDYLILESVCISDCVPG
jgi:hypothetical protein